VAFADYGRVTGDAEVTEYFRIADKPGVDRIDQHERVSHYRSLRCAGFESCASSHKRSWNAVISRGLRKRAGRERQRSGNRQSQIIEQFWRKVARRSQLCPFVAVSGRSRRLLQGKSRSLEAVPVDAQLSYFGFKCLSWNSQLNGGAGWTPNHPFGFTECGFEHFSFVLGKVSNERNRRHS
jgi:hypothetical protein